MFRNDINIAWRNLSRSKLYAFINIGGLAVGLDLAAAAVRVMGVSAFTSGAIELMAHGMLVLDLLLFVLYLARSSWALGKEMFK